MTSLVTCDDDAFGIGEVANATVLERIELVFVSPPQRFAKLLPLSAKNLATCFKLTWMHIATKDVICARLGKQIDI